MIERFHKQKATALMYAFQDYIFDTLPIYYTVDILSI